MAVGYGGRLAGEFRPALGVDLRLVQPPVGLTRARECRSPEGRGGWPGLSIHDGMILPQYAQVVVDVGLSAVR